jgi:hypothetical protein
MQIRLETVSSQPASGNDSSRGTGPVLRAQAAGREEERFHTPRGLVFRRDGQFLDSGRSSGAWRVQNGPFLCP